MQHRKVFRLQGIPNECETRADIRHLVKKALAIQDGASVTVYSLASSPLRQHSNVATLSFHTIPDCLTKCDRNEWVFRLPEDGAFNDGYSQRSLVFDTHFSGFTPLQRANGNGCEMDIIAISGLNGHAFGSFKERGGPFMWLRDALPLEIPNARILIYGYNTELIQSSSFQNLTDLGKVLRTHMRGIREHCRSRPIVFIGHSLGGLVIKEFIVNLKEEPDLEDAEIMSSLSGFLFFGVPHQGMSIKSLVPLVKDNPNRSLLESLDKNSGLLQRLERVFWDAIDSGSPKVISFYETKQSPTAVETDAGKWELSGPREILVDVLSATRGSTGQHPIDRTHSEMVKYTSEYDETYVRVLIALRSLISMSRNKIIVNNAECGNGLPGSLSDDNKQCIRSLSFREQEHRYNEIHDANNTCEWLLNDSTYQDWLRKSQGLFWIKGNPGAGKSVVMKFAVRAISNRKAGELVVCFFIHGRGKPLQRTPLGIFRGLLSSLLEHFPIHLSKLTERFNEQQQKFGDYQYDRWDWTDMELRKLLSDLLINGTQSQPVVIFVDALDECGQHSGKSLLEYFKVLMKDVEYKNGQVKICFSSRHYPILGLNIISTVHVEERNHQDIRAFIRERLKEIQPKENRQQLEKEILLKAQGGFQWVVLATALVIDEHEIGTKMAKIHEKITTIPEDLDELYTSILGNIPNSEGQQMVRLFQWVLFAARPLSIQELREALATSKDMSFTTISELRTHESWSDTLSQFKTHIRHISRGLVEFHTRDIWEQYELDGEDADQEAQFIHQSVADYVLKKYLGHTWYEAIPQTQTQTQIGTGNFEISRSCFRYLTLKEVLNSSQLSRGQFSARFPLVPYIVRYIFYHIKEVENEGIPQLDLLTLMPWGSDSETLHAIADIWKMMDPDHAYTPTGWPYIGATPLHTFIAFGSKSAFNALLEKDSIQVDGGDNNGNTPLLLALSLGHHDMALTLLDRFMKWKLHNKITDEGDIEEQALQKKKHYVNTNAANDDNEPPLTVAMTVDAPDIIFKLIEAGADLEFLGQGTALLFYAIRKRNMSLLLKLIEKGVNLDGAIDYTLRHLSINDEVILQDYVAELLKAGADTRKCATFDINHEDNSDDDEPDTGESEERYIEDGILFAARRGLTAVFHLFISEGAVSKMKDNHQRSPLGVAARFGHEDIVRALIEAGTDVNEIDVVGDKTPLRWAISSDDLIIAKLLIDNGADVNLTDSSGHAPLSLAISLGNPKLEKLLIENGADVNMSDSSGYAPLSLAINLEDLEIAELLIDNGADVNLTDSSGHTPLSLAISMGNPKLAKLLIDNGADVNLNDLSGHAPLSLAISLGNPKLAKLLIENGADVNMSDSFGRIPLRWAMASDDLIIAKLLIDNGADVNLTDSSGETLLSLALLNNFKMLKLLVENGADMNITNSSGETPLSLAISLCNLKIAKLLVENGADVNVTDSSGHAPLSLAINLEDLKMAELLIENGADVNMSDSSGYAPLSLAINLEDLEIAELLIENGADVNMSNSSGETPLSLAVTRGHLKISRLLIENKANINMIDLSGKTPLSFSH